MYGFSPRSIVADSPFSSVESRIETMKNVGVNVIEVNGLEYLYCSGNDVTCWGMLRSFLAHTQTSPPTPRACYGPRWARSRS